MSLEKLTSRLAATARAARAAWDGPGEAAVDRPRRLPDLELIGQYQDSGFNDPPFLVRRADGQVVQLSRLLYLLLEQADGATDLEQLATTVSQRFGRTLSEQNVALLVETKLRPAGLVCARDGSSPQTRRTDPLLALRYRAAVIPPGVVRAAARLLRPLCLPVVVAAALCGLLAFDIWLAQHGIGGAVRQLIAHPVLLLSLLGLVIVSALWHELGHATACAYGGATPGAMGVGLYVIWPAFYTDVTDAYRLRRVGRLRTDLGGVYFNALFALAAGGAYFATHFEPLLALVAVQHFEIIQQLTPLMRLDGYYVITDLVGVPDVLARLKPILLSFVPFRPPDRRVSELKRWVRAATSAYIVLFVSALIALLVLLGLGAPRFIPAAVHSADIYSRRMASAWHRHAFATAVLAEVQVLTVILPVVGVALGVLRLVRKAARRIARPDARLLRRAAAVALLAGLGLAWPALLWGLQPELQTHPAQASTGQPTAHPASRAPEAHHGPPAPPVNTAPTLTTPPSPPRSATATGPTSTYRPATTTSPTSSAGATYSTGTSPTNYTTTPAPAPVGTATTTPPSPSNNTAATSAPSNPTTTTPSNPTTTTPSNPTTTTPSNPTTTTPSNPTTTVAGTTATAPDTTTTIP